MLDGDDVIVVADASVVRRELEPFLSDEPVEFYDAVARPLRLVVEWERRRLPFVRRPRMHLELVSEAAQGQRLRSALTRYLQVSGRHVPDDDALLAFTTTAADRIRRR
ncbi:MAG TPA: hypothetical protein VFZ17_11255 [Acidimicrobiia bacterium]|nr:hypothetical protein [Acidimicrobiia bacterium]